MPSRRQTWSAAPGSRGNRRLLPGRHPEHDAKLQKSALGEFFLVLSVDSKPRERRCVKVGLLVDERQCSVRLQLLTVWNGPASAALDPGVRKTLTAYSPENQEAMMLGKGHATQLVDLLRQYDALRSKVDRGEVTGSEKKRAAKQMAEARSASATEQGS